MQTYLQTPDVSLGEAQVVHCRLLQVQSQLLCNCGQRRAVRLQLLRVVAVLLQLGGQERQLGGLRQKGPARHVLIVAVRAKLPGEDLRLRIRDLGF